MKIKDKESIIYILVIFLITAIFFQKIFINQNEILYFGDLVTQFSFWKYFTTNSVHIFGEIPLWNPFTFSGTPFVGNPLSNLFYPFNFIFFMFNTDFSLGIILFIHIFITGLFTYFFAREINLSKFSSFISSIIFVFSLSIISKVSAGQYTNILVISWMPLLFLLLEKIIKKESFKYGILFGIILGIQLLASHIHFFYVASLSLFTYSLFSVFYINKKKKNLISIIKILFLGSLISILISSIFLLPILEVVKYSTRTTVDYEFATQLSLPPIHLITFLIPHFFGSVADGTYWGYANFTELNGYLGILPLILALFALFYRKNKYTITFSLIALFSLLVSLGKYTFFFKIPFYLVPGFNMFRIPATFLFIYVFSVSIIAGVGVDTLLQKKKIIKKRSVKKFFILLFLASISLLILFLILNFGRSFFVPFAEDAITQKFNLLSQEKVLSKSIDVFLQLFNTGYKHMANGTIIATSLFLISTLTLILWFYNKINIKTFKILIVILILLDLGYFGLPLMQATKNIDEVYGTNELIDYLKKEEGFFRIYAPKIEELEQHIIVRHGIETVGGYDPTQLKEYGEFMQKAGNYTYTSYSTDIPPWQVINYNELLNPNTRLLGLLNVKYVILKDKTTNENLELKEKINGYFIYENKDFLPRAFLTKDLEKISNIKEAEILFYSPNKIELEIEDDEKGYLFLSENWFPGWKAYDNDKEVKIEKEKNFRVIPLDAGKHKIILEYRPKLYFIGRYITLLTTLVLLFYFLISFLVSSYNLKS